MANLIKTIKTKIQSFGGLLGQMIMPIIGIFIAWGLLTSFFIPTGWTPNKDLAAMVGVGITYIIPILICFLGGYKIYKIRGGAIAGVVAIGAVFAGQSEIFYKYYWRYSANASCSYVIWSNFSTYFKTHRKILN